jgi:glycosyltransferase involved in cell wall biosynthesis
MPAHKHVASLRHALASVQEQSLQDFEILIVGDGAGDAIRTVVAELAAVDRRIRFFDFPKGPRKGEIHRHAALQYAQGRFIAYLGDDDCWMPHHLEVLDALLIDADFGHTLQVGVGADGKIVVMPADLENPTFRARMLAEMFNRFDFTFGGHTMAAYRRLPYGWRTTPPDFPWTDLYMWRQFLAEPWCRARSAMVPTGINTWTHLRPHLEDEERAEDLAFWRAQAADAAFRESLWRQIAHCFAAQSVAFEADAVRHAGAYDALRAEHDALKVAHNALETEYTAIRNSNSWRVTRPLREARRMAARLRKLRLNIPGAGLNRRPEKL